MSNLYPIQFALTDRHFLVGSLDNMMQTLWEDGDAAEADECRAILNEVWEHTSHRAIDIPEDTPVTVALTPGHWFLLASVLDVVAFEDAARRPDESALALRLRDRISESLGGALPAPAQPSAPQHSTVEVQVDEMGCYVLFAAPGIDHRLPVTGYQFDYNAWMDEGNGLAVRSHILTGTRDGVVNLAAELLNAPPPLETESWDDIAEYSWSFWTTEAVGPPPRVRTLRAAAPGRDAVTLFEFDPVWPSTCMYRVRVSVRGRDAGNGEQHVIQLWRAPSAPARLIKATDMTGRRRRPGP